MKSNYIPSLDGLRACAFLLVLGAHVGLEKLIPGGLGVTVFFFLSGFLITTLLRLEFQKSGTVSLKNFYIRRSIRILPPMYLTMAVSWVALILLKSNHPGNALGFVSAVGYFFNYIDLVSHSYAMLPAGMGVLWSLMIEEHFYLLFPLLYLLLLRRRLSPLRQSVVLGALCCAALLWRMYLVYFVHTPLVTLPRWTYSASDARFDSILWGCILAIVCNPHVDKLSPRLHRLPGPLAALGFCGLIGTLLVREPHFRETLRYTAQALALLPIFYYCVARPQSSFVSWLEWKWLRCIGWLSYSMYLIHEVIIAALMNHGVTKPWQLVLIAFPLALLYATAMRYGVEQPLHRLRSSMSAAKTKPGKPIMPSPAPVLDGQLHAR